MDIVCCQQCNKTSATVVVDDPFSPMIVIDYYDGPVSGFTKCKVCQTEYHFYLLDWDADHVVRIFALAKLPPKSFLRLSQIFNETPTRHVWIPSVLSRPSEEELSKIYQGGLQNILDSAERPSIVMAWSRKQEKTICLRAVDSTSSADLPCWFDVADLTEVHDWFGYLQLTRDYAEAPK